MLPLKKAGGTGLCNDYGGSCQWLLKEKQGLHFLLQQSGCQPQPGELDLPCSALCASSNASIQAGSSLRFGKPCPGRMERALQAGVVPSAFSGFCCAAASELPPPPALPLGRAGSSPSQRFHSTFPPPFPDGSHHFKWAPSSSLWAGKLFCCGGLQTPCLSPGSDAIPLDSFHNKDKIEMNALI